MDSHSTVEVRRSARRRRTVSAFRENGRLVVAIPASFSARQEAEWVEKIVARLEAADRRRELSGTALAERARQLSDQYFGGRAQPSSIVWSTRQHHRWGSCTPADGSIRLARQLSHMPAWVRDYVIVHELAHLLRAGHDAEFWHLVNKYPETARAKAFLEGVSYATRHRLDLVDGGEDAGASEWGDGGQIMAGE